MPARQKKPTDTDKAHQLSEAERVANLVSAEEFINLLNDRRRFAWLNFRAGIYRGFGLTLGVALTVVILGWMVVIFGGIPYIGDFIRAIQDNV